MHYNTTTWYFFSVWCVFSSHSLATVPNSGDTFVLVPAGYNLTFHNKPITPTVTSQLITFKWKSKSCYNWRTVAQRVLVSSPIWGPRPDFCYCQIDAALSMWGTTPEERKSLSFKTISATGHEAYGVVRYWESHVVQTNDSQMVVRLPTLHAGCALPPEIFQYSFLLQAE
jgi:hypothetical protein